MNVGIWIGYKLRSRNLEMRKTLKGGKGKKKNWVGEKLRSFSDNKIIIIKDLEYPKFVTT